MSGSIEWLCVMDPRTRTCPSIAGIEVHFMLNIVSEHWEYKNRVGLWSNIFKGIRPGQKYLVKSLLTNYFLQITICWFHQIRSLEFDLTAFSALVELLFNFKNASKIARFQSWSRSRFQSFRTSLDAKFTWDWILKQVALFWADCMWFSLY